MSSYFQKHRQEKLAKQSTSENKSDKDKCFLVYPNGNPAGYHQEAGLFFEAKWDHEVYFDTAKNLLELIDRNKNPNTLSVAYGKPLPLQQFINVDNEDREQQLAVEKVVSGFPPEHLATPEEERELLNLWSGSEAPSEKKVDEVIQQMLDTDTQVFELDVVFKIRATSLEEARKRLGEWILDVDGDRNYLPDGFEDMVEKKQKQTVEFNNNASPYEEDYYQYHGWKFNW